MNRRKIIAFLNSVIEEEHGNKLKSKQLLVESNIDSFGYAVFWLSVNQEYNLDEIKGLDEGIDYTRLTLGDVVNYASTGDTNYILKNKINKKQKEEV